ncbi:alpha-glucan family phosphorylase [candidate division WWE3 bacterium CG_4_9_14_3_um_filter_41_6]|uniref:glycogen phosphorylase n=1 Tax=candidate division WWE3 bacterium CG_4_10_14_0_2_um_filter_41_14 TaxID=1975072 RepID=A0A2M7TIF5_UNCKA|nr:MAG: alpha-glucan family phosphorylase [candidate division WWE3 bacterium CG_4_10_14_0_2_um_filter_41_14]PJA38324.1 MAG: alpha-glucan family phosphorylase [candidate division WWE3 bacterium CG_4_9_14_3_um_filter_41_6]
MNATDNLVAYFSMEVGIDANIKTYSGGLGILAGDTLRSLADLNVPTIAITLLSEYGYFSQEIIDGQQVETYPRWDIEKYLEKLDTEIEIPVGPHKLHVKIWKYTLTGISGHTIPILFLDANHPKNPPELKKLTQRLYPTNREYRLLQEILLGVGGYVALQTLQYQPSIYHLNEGHSALLTLALYHDAKQKNLADPIDFVRTNCVFTTHTPVPAGHDRFTRNLVNKFLPFAHYLDEIKHSTEEDGTVNMTLLALSMCDKVNGVAKKHSQVSRVMFPGHNIASITNGVHHTFWSSPHFQKIFDHYLLGWREDPFSLMSILSVPREEIMSAHSLNKKQLVEYINSTTDRTFSDEVFTLGFARRMAKYKRADLLFYDVARLNAIAEKHKIQLVFAGKAHPEDSVGKSIIHEILGIERMLHKNISLVYLPDYNIDLAKIIIPGVDAWLNTPMRPHEASGTSGMKASLNGVPNISILDGWWIEGAIEGVTGWSIGPQPNLANDEAQIMCVDCDDSDDLYRKLDETILPMFYERPKEYAQIQRNCIGLHGSFFNTHRMVQQYIIKSYLT